MRRLASLLIFMLAQLALGQDALSGMKEDVITTPATPQPSAGAPPLLHLGVVVAVLFVLIKFVLPKALLKFTNKLNPGLGSSIKVEESATIGTGGAYVIEVRGRTLLIGASSTGGLSLLCDLTSDSEEPPAFFEMLNQAVVEPLAPEGEPRVGDRLREMLGA
ncbi:MAG: hypothetical protein JNK63_03290 [Chthonomonas sp.]|nr:hypothetical protein [Chthonomonas sp.]